MGIEERLGKLRGAVRGLGSAVIAFSGGVDSTLLARVAADELGGRVLLVTADSETYTSSEVERARALALGLGAEHVVIETRELDVPQFRDNPPDRCYHCKRELYRELDRLRRGRGFDCMADGTNADDAADYRPGDRAAREFGVRRPLAEIGLIKEEVRALSKHLGLPNWDRPAAACLASRIPYGTRIDPGVLRLVERAEKRVVELTGVRQLRVRHHGALARIEAPAGEVGRLAAPGIRERIVDALQSLGYHYVTLDLQGYRTGSLNEVLPESDTPDEN